MTYGLLWQRPQKRKTCWAHVDSQKCATKASDNDLFYFNMKFITILFMLQASDVIIIIWSLLSMHVRQSFKNNLLAAKCNF